MRSSPIRPARVVAVVAAAFLVALCATNLPAAVASGASAEPEPAASGGSPAPLGDASASPSPSASLRSLPSTVASPEPTSVTCAISPAAALYGNQVAVTGAVTPAAEGQEVSVTLDGTALGSATTDASGAYELEFTARRSGEVVAEVVADGTTSDPQDLVVRPKAQITHGAAYPFLRCTFVVKVTPASYAGLVTARVVHHGVRVATVKTRARSGKAVLRVPLRGINRFSVRLSLAADGGLRARTVTKSVKVKWARLARGSKGPRVRGMLTALKRLRVRVPYVGTTFNSQCGDAVVAFQKAYGLPRTYVFDGDNWRKIDRAKVVKPRHSSPKVHLEVDKRRQILMVVKNGAVYGLLAVSTGATGNTPEGTFHIQQKHPYTTSGYGGILFRTMGFYKDFAIHGYVPVPPYPASHGCIREPMWVANWTYGQSWVGEVLYVYH